MIERLYAEDAVFLADEPGDEPVECRGQDEIFDNITQVNERSAKLNGSGAIVRDHIFIG